MREARQVVRVGEDWLKWAILVGFGMIIFVVVTQAIAKRFSSGAFAPVGNIAGAVERKATGN